MKRWKAKADSWHRYISLFFGCWNKWQLYDSWATNYVSPQRWASAAPFPDKARQDEQSENGCLSCNHAWLYILGKAHTQLPFLTHLILVPSLGCVFLMRTCYQLIKIRQILIFFCKVSKPNYCSTNKWECFGANSFSKHWKNTCEIV